MRMRCFPVLSVLLSIGLGAGITQAQDSSNQIDRKIVKQTMPRYPDMARRMNLAGTVKVIAVVAPDGKVKKVEPMGGSPLLIQAAEDAISQWRFAPASTESRQVVELHFNP
jgi:TonB family protein